MSLKKLLGFSSDDSEVDETIERSINKTVDTNYIYNGVSILKPKSYDEDSRKIAEMIKNNNIVTFSLENISREEGQRLIDYISGASFVLGGTVVQVTDKVFASIPEGVTVQNN